MNISKFHNQSNNYSGSTKAGNKRPSRVTSARKKALATLVSMASQLDESQLDVATKILQGSTPELQKYVQANGTPPAANINRLIMQAAIIRLAEISSVSNVLDIKSDDAIKEIEEAESEAIEQNQADSILTPQAQAALLIVMESIMEQINKKTGISSVKEYISLLKGRLSPDNATGGVDFDINAALGGSSTDQTGSDSILEWINTAANIGLSIYNAVRGGTTSTGGINNTQQTGQDILSVLLGKIQGAASNTGSDAINKSIDKYKWYIIGGFAALLLTIIIVVYANKRK